MPDDTVTGDASLKVARIPVRAAQLVWIQQQGDHACWYPRCSSKHISAARYPCR